MFIELVDHLRCVRPHADICLVASAARMNGRHILDGLLGCPICHAEYPIRDGVAFFADDAAAATTAESATQETDPGGAMRLAAFLGMIDSRGFAVLAGRRALEAQGLRLLSESHLLLVNPPRRVAMDPGMSAVVTGETLPIAGGSARAVALDASATPALARTAVSALCAGGRMVGPAGMDVPQGITELARDALDWVGERDASSAVDVRPVRLVRR